MKGGKLVVTLERLSVALASIGNVLAHRLFSHLIRPPEEEETNIDRKRKEERRRRGRGQEKEKKGNIGFLPQKCGLEHGDFAGVSVDSDHCIFSRPFRGSFADFLGNSGAHIVSCHHVCKHQVPLVPKFDKNWLTCHEEIQ